MEEQEFIMDAKLVEYVTTYMKHIDMLNIKGILDNLSDQRATALEAELLEKLDTVEDTAGLSDTIINTIVNFVSEAIATAGVHIAKGNINLSTIRMIVTTLKTILRPSDIYANHIIDVCSDIEMENEMKMGTLMEYFTEYRATDAYEHFRTISTDFFTTVIASIEMFKIDQEEKALNTNVVNPLFSNTHIGFILRNNHETFCYETYITAVNNKAFELHTDKEDYKAALEFAALIMYSEDTKDDMVTTVYSHILEDLIDMGYTTQDAEVIVEYVKTILHGIDNEVKDE